MTSLPRNEPARKLGLVIDLDICVGCHACAVSCKEWNTVGHSAPLTDLVPYGETPSGVWFNRVHSYEIEGADGGARIAHFPRSCLHCDDAPCVTVCPTGASYKREEDGIVLVDAESCIGCKLCSWACPYGAREFDGDAGIMKKCTLCIDRIYNEAIPADRRVPACVAACPTGARSFGDLGDTQSEVSRLVEAREGVALMPEQGCRPVNRYLPPRPSQAADEADDAEEGAGLKPVVENAAAALARWAERLIPR